MLQLLINSEEEEEAAIFLQNEHILQVFFCTRYKLITQLCSNISDNQSELVSGRFWSLKWNCITVGQIPNVTCGNCRQIVFDVLLMVNSRLWCVHSNSASCPEHFPKTPGSQAFYYGSTWKKSDERPRAHTEISPRPFGSWHKRILLWWEDELCHFTSAHPPGTPRPACLRDTSAMWH